MIERSQHHFYPPMIVGVARTIEDFPNEEGWTFEPKLNGYRIQAVVNEDSVQLYTRPGNVYTDRQPGVIKELPAAVRGLRAIIDGEMIVEDANGHENLKALSKPHSKATLVIFDILEFGGTPVMDRPIEERREFLDFLIIPADHVKRMKVFGIEDRDDLLASAEEQGREGVVAKRLGSKYESGHTSKLWLKYKFKRPR